MFFERTWEYSDLRQVVNPSDGLLLDVKHLLSHNLRRQAMINKEDWFADPLFAPCESGCRLIRKTNRALSALSSFRCYRKQN